MCGIAGFWAAPPHRNNRADFAATLRRMSNTLTHRGPDGRGEYLRPADGLAMGHTRLSIVDLSERGRQPIVQGDLVLSINGELYDYKPMRARLACRGERFDTKTDSEIAIKLYRAMGLDFVRQLRGEFAIALYDASRQRLVLARDRFGVRPLYYSLGPRGLVYASEIKALLEHPDVPRRLDVRAALHQMMQTMVPGMTGFEEVRALLPGHLMVVERDGDRLVAHTTRYWDVDYPLASEHDPNPNPDYYIGGLQERLIDAVRVRLEADVPVGCYLSGGIDSCSILGLSTAMQQSPVKAFTISFDDDAYDEASVARSMAERAVAEQEILHLAAAELYGDSFRRTLWHSERTFYNTLGVAKWHMSKRVRECGFKVVVTGEGSDELFGGYPFFKRDFFAHAAEGSGATRSGALFTGAILSETEVRHAAWEALVGFTPSWVQPWMLTLELARPLFSDAARAQLEGYDPIEAIAASLDPDQIRGRHPLDKVQYTWIKTMLEGQILNWGGDRVDMANSMESRPPFLDHELAHFARSVPPQLRIRGGVEKWVLREAMKGVLPRELYEREKFPFMAPPAHTDPRKQHAIAGLINSHLAPHQIEDAGLFSPARVRGFLDAYWAEQDRVAATRNDIVLNHLLGLHLLHQQYVDGDVPAAAA